MKILFITNYVSLANASGGFIDDYVNDSVFHGLREIYGWDITDSTKIISLYKEYEEKIPKQNLWGGMSLYWLFEEDNADRSNIEDKIINRFYDLIIYGCVRKCLDYYSLVTKYYKDYEIVCIDSSDQDDLDPLYLKHLYFKRELNISHPNLRPITFSIPECKIAKTPLTKIKDYGTCIPGQPETYIFKNEKDYYEDYQKSYYGVTMKKAGWDCMRHYEILANYCIPYFIDLENCPKNTLTHLPKDLLLEARNLINNFNEQEYYRILNELFDYTKKHLTTKAMAQYIINEIKKYQITNNA